MYLTYNCDAKIQLSKQKTKEISIFLLYFQAFFISLHHNSKNMKRNLLLAIIQILIFTMALAQQNETKLPQVSIDTYSGRPIASKDVYVLSQMAYTDESNVTTYYDSLWIRGRGNSTWGLAKKPYKLKFEKKQKLLGKGYANAKKWTLLANHADKTLIRNALTSLMGKRAGLKFNPAAKFVDLTLNGEYVGNYQISDQVEVKAHRVNITEQDLPLTEKSDITGGYLLEVDGFKDFHTSSYWNNEVQKNLPPDGFITPKGSIPVRIHYPDAEDLEQKQTNYIIDYVKQFEKRLYDSNFDDPDEGYRQLVDSTSLVNWYLCTEISGNVDGCFSSYFYKEQGDPKLYWGPLWDYDIAYNNDNRTDRLGTSDTRRQLMKDASYGNLKLWLQRMWKDTWFARLVNRRYSELTNEGMEDYLYQQIDSLTTLLQPSIERNYQRWGINTRALRERVLYNTYDQYITDLKEYIHVHLEYLKEAFASLLPDTPEEPEKPDVLTPDFTPDTNRYYTISNSATATCAEPDAATFNIVGNARQEASLTQQWYITTLQNGYQYIVNRATGQALNDPTPGQPEPTTLTGTQLNTAEADSTDTRQQWNIISQPNNRFNLVNHYSGHAANLSGGGSSNGTPILSYTSDERNAYSNNRLWTLQDVDYVVPTDINLPNLAETDYALAYDTETQHLHFGTDDPTILNFKVSVYNRQGHLIRIFSAATGSTLADLPNGLYLISWTAQRRQHTIKLIK